MIDTARALAVHAGWFKVGLEAFTAHGPAVVEDLAGAGHRVFLDLKLHDIPATVRRAAANCAGGGAHMFNVHASGGRAMLEAAVAGAREGALDAPPRVVAVTVLTSLDDDALAAMGVKAPIAEIVVSWARLAQECGLDGVVCSAREAPSVRAACGERFLLVTPGIRPAATVDDQRRTVTPRQAIAAGADILVVGRPITSARSPAEAAQAIVGEMG
jgi:orotidine-5'-phosphate decarboxylase